MSLKKFVAITAFALATASLLMALPAEAKQPKKLKAPYALSQIDRNGNRSISNKEWNWAEKKGYDRVTRNGNRVTRKTYQAYVNRYYTYVGRRQSQDDRTWGYHRPGAFVPWEWGQR